MQHTSSNVDSGSNAASQRGRPSEIVNGRLSRRRVLGAGGTALVTSLAGCFDGGGTGTQSPTGKTTPPPDSVFQTVSFDVRGGQFSAKVNLAVSLQSEHDLDQVNLIAPDGSLFTSAQVATGATTVHLEVLEVRSGTFSHYSPGKHKLVAIRGDKQVRSMAIELQPILDIVSVEPYRTQSGDQQTFLGDIIVRIKNRGTAPTWVYDFDLPKAPNPATASSPSPDSFFLLQPTNVRETVILPRDKQMFAPGAGDKRSFQLHTSDLGKNENSCAGQKVTTPIVIHTPVGTVSQRVQARFTGKAAHRFAVEDRYVCTETTFHLVEDKGGTPNA